MKNLFAIAITFLCVYANGQIQHSILIQPTIITTNDTVIIESRIRLPNGCHLSDSSTTIVGNTIYTNACYYFGWTNTAISSYDTIRYKFNPLNAGVYEIRYIVRATVDSLKKRCEEYNRIDSTITSFVVGTTGIEAIDFISILYPNPVCDKLYFKTEQTCDKVSFQVVSTTGQLLLQNAVTQQPNFTIDVSTLPAGLYFLQLSDGKQRVVKKFAKE